MQGRRVEMQDTTVTVANFCGAGTASSRSSTATAAPTHRASARSRPPRSSSAGSIAQTPEETFVELNDIRARRNSLQDVIRAGLTDGSVANVVIVTPFKCISANCGDSRALIIRANALQQLSLDHKSTQPDEYARLRAVGGFIDHAGRLNGGLAVSRAIGDVDCQPAISPVPDVRFYDRVAGDIPVVVACDGVWDVHPRGLSTGSS